MEHFSIAEDLHLTGIRVNDFPQGIQQAFTRLLNTLGNGHIFYGISWMDNDGAIVYYAMAREAFPGEGKPHQYESLTIENGVYKTEAIYDWMNQTECIKDVLHRLTAGSKPGKENPCVEWYKSDKEMLCMPKA